MANFNCQTCGAAFQVPAATLERYPGWTPRHCNAHRPARAGQRGQEQRWRGAGPERELLSTAEVLARYPDPGEDGVFTDGSCSPNPGPGGWGLVWVEGGRVLAERSGFEPETTNNRMELRALIEAYRLLPEDARVTVHSDSNLCVQTIREWAPGWERRGWKRRSGPIANLDLVKELHALARAHPGVELRWIRAHAGHRWNEYADALASAWQRPPAAP